MVMICHCTGVSDTDLKEALEAFRKATYGGVPESREDLAPLIGNYDAGCCSRIFERALTQYADTGEFNLFKRSIQRKDTESGLCSVARSRRYSADGVPDLMSSPIQGDAAP